MAPSVLIDTTPDFNPLGSQPQTPNLSRTLLLSPPSLSSHPELLDRISQAHDRNVTDIQMLDRLALGMVALPAATYDVILILTDADGTRSESQRILDRNVLGRLVQALKTGGKLKSQDGSFATQGVERTEAILAGLTVDDGDGAVKPKPAEGVVKLSFGRKANAAAGTKRAAEEAQAPAMPAGVVMVDPNDDFDDFDDDYIPSKEELLADEQIDPETLLTEEDRQKPIIIRECSFPPDPG